MGDDGGVTKLEPDLARRGSADGEYILYRGRWMLLLTIVLVRMSEVGFLTTFRSQMESFKPVFNATIVGLYIANYKCATL
jgi:hypothetical protein